MLGENSDTFHFRCLMDQTAKMLALSVLIGVVAGLGAAGFRWMITFFQQFFFVYLKGVLAFMGDFWILAVLSTGGLAVGLLTYFGAREAKGHGVPEVMEAVWSKGGIIRARVAIVKTLASALCIGSGGSVGREGPIVQIGASFGSTMGQWFKLKEEWIRLLVACGAAGGISATFNAPLGGVFFSLELILGTFETHNFGFVVISSLTAAVVTHSLEGNQSVFEFMPHALNSVWGIPLFAVLGVATGVAGGLFIRLLYKSEDIFDSVKIVPEYLKPAIGGLLVACLGLYSFDIFGVGYGSVPWVNCASIDNALRGQIELKILIIIVVLKILATCLTIGSGGSGGIFAPSLFIGAFVGGCFGKLLHIAIPDISIPTGVFSLVGMGAFFAGVSRAPITSTIIIFEMTRRYDLMLPLLLAVVASSFTAYLISKETIYTLKILRRQAKQVQ